MKCPTCGRWNKKGEKQERMKLVTDLCFLLGWNESDKRRLYSANAAFNQKQLKELIAVISIEDTGK